MNVLALDLSLTSTGYAWRDDVGELIYGTIVSKHTGMQRLAYIDSYVMGQVDESGATLVSIEGYSYGSKGRAVFQIGELGGVVRMSLFHAGIEQVDVAPSVIKKYATSRGNAPKDAVRDCARDRFGLDVGVSSDVCDAVWLLAVTYEALGRPIVEVPKAHRVAAVTLADVLGDGRAA